MTFNDLLQELLKLTPEQLKEPALVFPSNSHCVGSIIPLDEVIAIDTIKNFCSGEESGEEVDKTSSPDDGKHHPQRIALLTFGL
jgi:hypothetical protein